jgi:small subunit ribosomal protein S20
VAHSLSAKKRIRQNARRRAQSRARKSQVKAQIRRFLDAVSANDLSRAESELRAACRKLDRVASTSTMHKNTASRKKSRLQRRLNALRAGSK